MLCFADAPDGVKKSSFIPPPPGLSKHNIAIPSVEPHTPLVPRYPPHMHAGTCRPWRCPQRTPSPVCRWRAPAPAGGAAHPYVSERGGRSQVDPHTFLAPADCTQPVFKLSITRSYCTQDRRGPSDEVPIPGASPGNMIATVTGLLSYFARSNI